MFCTVRRELTRANVSCSRFFQLITGCGVVGLLLAGALDRVQTVQDQPIGPSMLRPNLDVRAIVTGLVTPTTMAFTGTNELLILEKGTGKVLWVVNGAVHSTALDLAVNAASERGLLGIALHPDFPANPRIYLYWTCRAPASSDPFTPAAMECPDVPATGADTEDLAAVPLLGNRVDSFVWNGATLTFERNLVKLLAFQHDGAPEPPNQGDETQPARGNHDGGVLAFEPDRKLYVMVGDLGRRGQLQNLPSGPTLTGLGPAVQDDQFGGPSPDAAHFAGVILRLNDDGTTPTDNPFSAPAHSWGEPLVRTFSASSPMASATALGWLSIRSRGICGIKKMARMPSTS